MILWDVSLCLYFVFFIEDTVSFKFGGVCVGVQVGLVFFFFFIFACFMHVLDLIFISFSLFFFF